MHSATQYWCSVACASKLNKILAHFFCCPNNHSMQQRFCLSCISTVIEDYAVIFCGPLVRCVRNRNVQVRKYFNGVTDEQEIFIQ